jgi:hypothetical protein
MIAGAGTPPPPNSSKEMAVRTFSSCLASRRSCFLSSARIRLNWVGIQASIRLCVDVRSADSHLDNEAVRQFPPAGDEVAIDVRDPELAIDEVHANRIDEA